MPDAARNEPVPVRFFLWNTGRRALRLLLQPAGVGVPVIPAGALSHELADLGYEGQRRVDLLGSVEFLLQLVRREPDIRIPTGLVIGHHAVVHHAVVDEAGDAHAALRVAFLPAGQFQLDDNSGW